MMLRYGFNLNDAAASIESAVKSASSRSSPGRLSNRKENLSQHLKWVT